MKVKVKETSEVIDAFPSSLDGKFAVQLKDGRILPWDDVESVGDHCPVSESVATQVTAVPVSVRIGVSATVKETAMEAAFKKAREK